MSAVHSLVNCGFARVAIHRYSVIGNRKGKKSCDMNVEERDREFRDLFRPVASYVDETHFNEHGQSRFQRNCKKNSIKFDAPTRREGGNTLTHSQLKVGSHYRYQQNVNILWKTVQSVPLHT